MARREYLPIAAVPVLPPWTSEVALARIAEEQASRPAHVLAPVAATVGAVASRESGLAELHFDKDGGASIIRQAAPEHDVHCGRRLAVGGPLADEFAEERTGWYPLELNPVNANVGVEHFADCFREPRTAPFAEGKKEIERERLRTPDVGHVVV
ncbi:MAG: hypothetical protein F4029_19175 [Gammaproteobacteria bacterium]|nr:hypothetical protein [Gammaproteobacteria bacterium]MYF30298.1 hypothetical protein [Gammaproteobacteria bacterium]MYK48336.1 hypothetical protein [Gammaproteobacteria bacterium]